MTLDQGLAFLLFSTVAAVTPGPSNTMLTATGAAVGLWRGLPCLLGVSAGMAALIFCTAIGLGQLVLGHPQLLRALNWAGAAFLLWLAWKIASAGRSGEAQTPRAVGFVPAAALQWVNPKSWVVGASAAGTYLQADAGGATLQAIAFAALFVAAALPSGLLWLALGASMHRLLRSASQARIFNIAMGAALAASVAMILA